MTRWYRAYEGTVTDSKLGEVAIIAATSRSVVIATWHAILENCANVNDGGRFEISPRRVAAALVEPVSTIEQVFAGLEEVGMTTAGAASAWSKRQYESDNSTGRSQKHREAKRNGQSAPCNADATLQQQHATPPETETETETETEKKEVRAPARKARKCELPEDFKPNLESSRSAGLSTSEAEREFVKFKNHAKQNGRLCVNWQAAWSNWCIKAAEFLGREPPILNGAAADTGIFVKQETPQWDAWQEHLKATTGKGSPCVNFGWRFPAEWPPGHKAA